ncbi:MAG: glycosyltransferase family 2 protein [Armatimonadetes bacterium]|nr:glycosyltransferase family 2 protein [Armatimonadota bacterium]
MADQARTAGLGERTAPDFSVVVPVYGGAATVEELYDRLAVVFHAMNVGFEVIFVDDASPDGALAVLRRLHARAGNVRVIALYRNYGQQNALMCGFGYCRGRYVVTLDDDLQNPPEELPLLYSRLQEGFDAVFGAYRNKQHRAHRNLGSMLIRKVNHRVFDIRAGLSFSSYRIIRREIIDQIKGLRTPFPYISGMILNVSSNVANVEVRHEPRKLGRSSYSLRKLVDLSFNLLINYSSIPLRFVGYVGLVVSVLGLCAGLIYIARQFFLGRAPAGWTTIVALLSFYNTIILLIFFILGEYISRILREISRQNPYSIKEVLE